VLGPAAVATGNRFSVTSPLLCNGHTTNSTLIKLMHCNHAVAIVAMFLKVGLT